MPCHMREPRHHSHKPEKMLAGPPQKEVDANELNPTKFDDSHEGSLNAVSGERANQCDGLNKEQGERIQLWWHAKIEFDEEGGGRVCREC